MQFCIDLHGLVGFDPMQCGFAVDGAPTRRSLGPLERQTLSASLALAGRKGRLAQQAMDVGNGSHSLTIRAPGSGLTFALPASTSIFTVAAGISISSFAGVGIGGGGGVYGSNKPETGLFYCANDGVFLNVGVSADAQLTWVFGPPSTFAGVAWGAGLSIDIPGIPSVGGAIWFSLAYRPHPILTLIAVSMDVSLGLSALPFTISLQRSRTTLVPRRSSTSSAAGRGSVAAAR